MDEEGLKEMWDIYSDLKMQVCGREHEPKEWMAKETESDVEIDKTCWEPQKTNLAE